MSVKRRKRASRAPFLGFFKPDFSTISLRPLPLAAFVFFALSCVLNPGTPLHSGQLFDPDDYMRLNQTVAWLQGPHLFGGHWFDLSVPRLSPGDHTVVHWARLLDLPIALVMWPFIHLYGVRNAALIASFTVPPLLFLLPLFLLPALARPLLGKPRNDLAALMLLFAPAVLINFTPGRVDHHGYQVVIGAFGLLCLQRLILCPRAWGYAIAAAFAFACGLWIGTEALPWLLIFIAALGMLASWRGGFALRNTAVFGAALPIAIAVVVPLALPPAEYTDLALSWFSSADLILALLAGTALIAGWSAGRKIDRRWLRVTLMAALGIVAALLFVHFVPEILRGPFADYDDFNSTTALDNIGEAQPLWPTIHGAGLHAALLIARTVFLPLLASCVVLWNLARGAKHARTVWLMHGLFLLPAFGLTLFWQMRVEWFAQIFSLAPVAWLIWRAWSLLALRIPAARPRFWAEIAVFCLIAVFPVVLLPEMIARAPVYPDTMLFPAAVPAASCPLARASEFLDGTYGSRPHLIMSGMNEGPELLFRTPFDVVAAPFNVPGNTDSFDFFNARDDKKALEILRRRKPDLVLICRNIPLFYAGLATHTERFHADLFTDKQGNLHIISSKDHPTLIERLVNGKPPGWLKPVVIPLERDYLLFEVRGPHA